MGKGIAKKIQTVLIVLVALIFLATTLGTAYATETFQIPAKGQKKIRIGVLDLYSAIEIAALTNQWHQKHAKDRGWEVTIFDIGLDYAKAQTMMENMISAGYDAILVNFIDFKYIAPQILKAWKKGIPVQGVANGNNVPGVISQGTGANGPFGALSATALVTKVDRGEKILTFYDPRLGDHKCRFDTAKVTFDMYGVKIHQELYWSGKGDPAQECYETVKNALLADTKKEVKGIWCTWSGYGVAAARAANDLGRKEIVVVCDSDDPAFYRALRELPTLFACAGTMGLVEHWTGKMYWNLDKIFAGKPFQAPETWFDGPYLVTKDNQPPAGYFYNPCGGYKNRPPDYKVK